MQNCAGSLLGLWLVAQPSKSAARRDKSREYNVSKQKWNLCELKQQWKTSNQGVLDTPSFGGWEARGERDGESEIGRERERKRETAGAGEGAEEREGERDKGTGRGSGRERV